MKKKQNKKKNKENLLLYLFFVSLLFSNDTSRPLYWCFHLNFAKKLRTTNL